MHLCQLSQSQIKESFPKATSQCSSSLLQGLCRCRDPWQRETSQSDPLHAQHQSQCARCISSPWRISHECDGISTNILARLNEPRVNRPHSLHYPTAERPQSTRLHFPQQSNKLKAYKWDLKSGWQRSDRWDNKCEYWDALGRESPGVDHRLQPQLQERYHSV